MNEFRKSLIYSNNGMYNRKNSSASNNKATIKGRSIIKNSRRYTSKEIMRNRLIALALAGVAAIGVGIGTKSLMDRAKEEKYVSNFEEINQYDVQAQQLGISQELYDKIMQFKERMDKIDFEQVSNDTMASYFSEISNLYLNILKSKVSSVIGKPINEFRLSAPKMIGGVMAGTRILEDDSEKCIGTVESKEIDEYMNDILYARDQYDTLTYGNVDRKRLEKDLLKMTEGLGEVMTINLLRDGNKDKNKLVSYRIETRDLKQKDLNLKTAQIENEPEL